jgi:hypothetical protein
VSASVPSGSMPPTPDNKKMPSGKGGWYDQLSDEKKVEYLNKLCVSYMTAKESCSCSGC